MSSEIGFGSQVPGLPTGGASVGGLGETFSPDLSTGTGTFAVSLDTPHGPNDIGPRLSLRYDTGSPNGPFGLGWSLPLPRLVRSKAFGRPSYDIRDTLVLEGSGPLVADGAVLRPQVDTGDWRIEPLGTAEAPGLHRGGFVATDRAGTRFLLGSAPESQIPGPTGVPWAWLLHQIEDNVGGSVQLTWLPEGTQRYLQTIAYGPYELRFSYESRPDQLWSVETSQLIAMDQRCSAIELHLVEGPPAVPSLARRWTLAYEQSDPSRQSVLTGVTLTGFGTNGEQLSAPTLHLGYGSPSEPRLIRLNSLDPAAAPPGIDQSGRVELIDWDGDGLPDVLEIGNGGSARVWLNRGGSWDRPRLAGELPQLSAAGARAGLADLNGDGLADVVRLDRPPIGYQPRTEGGFGPPITWRQAPPVAFGAASARISDFDGDGVPDALWSVGTALLLAHRTLSGDSQNGGGIVADGWSARPLVVESTRSGVPTDLADPHVFSADMTGDGSVDLVRVDGGGVRYWPYLGDGQFGTPVTMASSPELPFALDPTRLFVVDVDGDGCADIILVDDGVVRWWPNQTGTAFGPVREVRHLPTGAMKTLRVADVLGMGTPALCWTMTIAGRTSWYALDLLGGTKPGVLTSIDNGVGLTTSITYATSSLEAARDRSDGRAWATRLPVVVPVVAETVTTDSVGPGSTSTIRYRYHSGRFDPALREFCGFGEVEQIEVGDDNTPTLLTVRHFHTGLMPDGTEPTTIAERRRFRSIRGRLLSIERTTEDGHIFDRVDYEWEIADTDRADVVRPRQKGMTKSVFEGDATPVSWITTENLAWDETGNLTQAEERSYERATGATTPTGVLRTNVEFAVDPNGRYRQRVARVVQTDDSGVVIADTRTEYDGGPTGTVGDEGLVTARSALAVPDEIATDVYGADQPDFAVLGYRHGDGGWWIDLARYQRTDDGAGLRGTVTGPRGAVTQLAFDSSRSFPASVTDAGGNVTTAEHDLRVCRVTTLTDTSGQTTTAEYDALARVTALIRPGDTKVDPGVAYTYATQTSPVRTTTSERTGNGTQPTVAHDFNDGSGRLIQRQVIDNEGVVADVSTAYGARSLPSRVWLPIRLPGIPDGSYGSPPGAAASTELFYDAIGRPAATVRPDGTRRTIRHLPGVIEEADEEDLRTDPNAPHAGTTTRQLLDAAGRAHTVEQQIDSRTLRSTYAFDLKGRLRSQTDATGSSTEFTHDLLGRLLRVQRPEATTVAVLDAAGNLAESRTGTARVLRTYDNLDRPIEVRHDAPTAAPAVRCTYEDTGRPPPPDSGTHTIGGRLVRVDHEGGSYTYDYDELGRIARKTMTPAGGAALSLDLEYRPDGLLDRVTYPGSPNRPVVVYHYDRRGRLTAVDGVIDSISYDPAGRRLETRYSNGVVQQHTYDDATGWLASLKLAAGSPGPTVLRDLTYRHDLTGNLLAIDSPDPALAWTYTYDDLYRIVEAKNGADVLSYSYDDSGNLLDASGRGTYHYGENGAPATELTSIVGTGGTQSFSYDDRGHLDSAPWGTHTTDAEGRLRRIELTGGGNDAFDYDHAGALVHRRTTLANGQTVDQLTPDPLIEVNDGELVLGITDGTRIVARVHEDGSRNWLHVDHLGSLTLITDPAGKVIADIRYGPYGEVRSRTGTATDKLGYATGQAAGPNLVLLGDRWYCPELGRFLSPDPVAGDVYEPLSWNAYSYCLCNPTSIIDPTGRSFWKVFAAVLATIAIVAVVVIVSVFTFGIASPGAIAIGAAGISLTWGAVFAATIAGVVIGGVIGGIAAARAGGDAGDIVLGALVGGAVGGWAAFGAAFAGPAVAGVFGLHGGVAAGAVAGAVSGTISGGAMGFASGFAGGRNNGLGDIMTKVLVGALIGAVIGGALGAASGIQPPKNPDGTAVTPGQAFQKSITPDPPAPQGPASLASPSPTAALPVQSATPLGIAGQGAARLAGNLAPIYASQITGFTGSIVTQTIAVDLLSGTGSLLFTDLQQYLRTHRVDLGPFNFAKGSWSGYP